MIRSAHTPAATTALTTARLEFGGWLLLAFLLWLLVSTHDVVARPLGTVPTSGSTQTTATPAKAAYHQHAEGDGCAVCRKLQHQVALGSVMVERTATGVQIVTDFSGRANGQEARAHDPHYRAMRSRKNNQLAQRYNAGNLL